MSKIYYVETGAGCTLIEAGSIERAVQIVVEEVGTIVGVGTRREATDEDIEWVRAMGGGVPDHPRTKKMFKKTGT